jgi:hypothetical protein
MNSTPEVMMSFKQIFTSAAIVALTISACATTEEVAQDPYAPMETWGQLPEGREWGSTSAVYPATDGSGDIWVAERCGQNSCTDREDWDTVFRFAPDGTLKDSFGAGLILMPHGIFVDFDGNVWVTDTGRQEATGYQVHKFSPEGEVLMTLGTAGGVGDGPDSFNGPSDVLVAPNGDIFVATGHLGRGDDNRIVKFSSDGTFIMQWGKTGSGNDEFWDPHALGMDSEGLLYVGDRYNNRVQIFNQEGEYQRTWTQFGRPSGVYVDGNDVLYVADSESNTRRNGGGWQRGVRIGSVTDGIVRTFILDPELDPDNSSTSGAEGVAADAAGNIFAAEVGPRQLVRHVKN